jgi:hypothetical protein
VRGSLVVIVSPAELELVQRGKRRMMMVPVERGSTGARRPCALAVETVVKLQPKAGVKGTAITVTEIVLSTLGLLTDADARQQGYTFRADGLEAFVNSHGGQASDDREVWAVRFVLGDQTAFYRGHQERYLRRKMGGGRSYTTNPAEGVFGEGAVPDVELVGFAAQAAATREEEGRLRLQNALVTIRQAIAETDGMEIAPEARKDLAWMRRRAARIEKQLTAAA